MSSLLRVATALLAIVGCLPASAQTGAQTAATGAVTAAGTAALTAAGAASAPARRAMRPHITVIEDDNARIEEIRGRNGVERVVVQSKIGGVRPYQIQAPTLGRDPSQERGNAGRPAWSILNF
ncbi:MAG: hypothetical protein LH480_02615 [Rubrivivax sp.]|nr:hypothetical protein [Rubrivivax sp.]